MSFDRDLKAKEKAKYDDRFGEMEREARDWISEILKRDVGNDGTDLCETLKDGTILCELANVVTPGGVRFKKSRMPFIQMENIAAFLRFCSESLRIPAHDLFQTIDLYERKNCFQVIQSLHTFSRYAVSQGGLDARFLGPRMATSTSRVFSEAQMREAKNHVNTYQYGKFSGSTNVISGTAKRDPAGLH